MKPRKYYMALGKKTKKDHCSKAEIGPPFRVYEIIYNNFMQYLSVDVIEKDSAESLSRNTDEYWKIHKWVFQRNILKQPAGCRIKKKEISDYL